MQIKYKLKLVVLASMLALYGCEHQCNMPNNNQSAPQTGKLAKIATKHFNITAKTKIWRRLRNNFSLNLARNNSTVQFHAEKYRNQDRYLQKVTNHAAPYLTHIVEQLEKRNMPGELALLPMIESSFNPHARSGMGATGIWQLCQTTGKRYGLKQNAWHDERTNLTAATNAALSYLQFLHGEFDGDWILALAAYNAGEGRVRRAINRNLAQNKPTDFWSLTLPIETKNFVPKLLALANLVKYADMTNVTTMKLGNDPYYFAMATRLSIQVPPLG